MASLQKEIGDNLETKRYLVHALDVAKKLENAQMEGRILFGLATVLKDIGDREDAREYYKAAIIKLGQHLDDNKDDTDLQSMYLEAKLSLR